MDVCTHSLAASPALTGAAGAGIGGGGVGSGGGGGAAAAAAAAVGGGQRGLVVHLHGRQKRGGDRFP